MRLEEKTTNSRTLSVYETNNRGLYVYGVFEHKIRNRAHGDSEYFRCPDEAVNFPILGGVINAHGVRCEISLFTTHRYPSQRSLYHKTEP
jgi:hypothetical protein